MVRPASFDSNGMKKGAWSEEEDYKLRAYVMRYGHWNWRLLPKYAGLARCGKSCRLRWVNYLKPGVTRGNFTKQEDELIAKLHEELGNKWSLIAAKLPGRTDNEIKNYWHTHIKKRHNRRNNPTAQHIEENSATSEAYKSELPLEDAKKPSETTSWKTHQFDSPTSLIINAPNELDQNSAIFFDIKSSASAADTPWANSFPIHSANSFQSNYLEKEFHNYPHFQYSQFSSSSSSSYDTAIDLFADDDYSITSSGSVAQPIQGSFWSELLASVDNAHLFQRLGELNDPFLPYFDHGTLFEP